MRAEIMAGIVAFFSGCAPEFEYKPMPAMNADDLTLAVLADIPVDSLVFSKPNFNSSYIDSGSPFVGFGKQLYCPADGMVISLPRAAKYDSYAICLEKAKKADSAARADIKAYVDTVISRDSANKSSYNAVVEYKKKHRSDFFKGAMFGSAVTALAAACLSIFLIASSH